MHLATVSSTTVAIFGVVLTLWATMIRDLMIGGASVEDTQRCGLLCCDRPSNGFVRCLRRSGSRSRRGSFSMDVGATSRVSLPHTEKHQCRSMCTANSMKKSSIASRGGGVDKDHESSRHISLCVPSMIKVFMSASTARCRLPQALAGYASLE